ELPPRQLMPRFRGDLDWWSALKGDLEVRLNRATYDTRMRNVEAVGFADADTLVLEVANEYVKGWFHKSIEAFCIDAYNRMDKRGERYDKPSISFAVVIEGDDQYRTGAELPLNLPEKKSSHGTAG